MADPAGAYLIADAVRIEWIGGGSVASDTTPPTVALVAPLSGATSVAPNASVTVTFSELMTATTITAGTFELRDPSGNQVAATVSYDAATQTATLDPVSPLDDSSGFYTALVRSGPTGVKDLAGNPLATDFAWSFTTAVPPMTVLGSPTVDGNGVKYYSVVSGYIGAEPTTLRILEPTNPAPGQPHRFLYVLPVEPGVTDLNSQFGDGLEQARLLNLQNLYNLTLVAPSFPIDPWYGDNDINPDRRLESFVVKAVVPFVDQLDAAGPDPERWLVGFSKSGFGALTLIFRHPDVFDAAAAWDAPAQLTTSPGLQWDMADTYGTEANFVQYEIPGLVAEDYAPFLTSNRIWISGDVALYTADMATLDQQMTSAGILHTYVGGVVRSHSWSSGWLQIAIGDLASTSVSVDLTAPVTTAAVTVGTSVSVDLTAPVTTAAVTVGTLGTNGWYTSAVTIGLSATDNLSNVAATYYSLNGGTTWAAGTSVAVSAQGTTTVSYYSVDYAGNTEAVGNYAVKIDTVAPTVTAPNITTGPNEATGARVFYTGASASDQTSDVSSLTFNPPSGSHFLVGTTTVNYTAIDNAGNSAQGSFTVTVNQTGFVGSVLYVIGTSGNDAFVINGTNPSSVPITIGGTAVYGSPFNLSRGQTINVYGNAGNDTFTISGAVGATLDGGTGSNTFTVTSYTGTGTLTGGGSDTVVATKNVAAINLSNTAFSTPADGMSLTISGMGTANITGGAANNTYNVSGWTGAGNFAAGGGTDTLNYTNDVSGIVLTNTSVAISGGASVTLSGFEVANLTGGSSANIFDVTGWTGTGSLTGNGATSTVAATKNTDTTLTNSSLTAGTMNMMLSGITLSALTANNTASRVIDASAFSGSSTLIAAGTGRAKLFGGSGNDTLRVTGSGPAVLVGGDGADMLSAEGSGRTILIGGLGADSVTSTGGGQAILIGGNTTYDAPTAGHLTALDAILNEWNSGRSFSARINNIRNGTGSTGGNKFDATTIFNDGAVDVLTSNATGTGQCWLIKRGNDTLNNKATDQVDDLGA